MKKSENIEDNLKVADKGLDKFWNTDIGDSFVILFSGFILDVFASAGDTSLNNLKVTMVAFFASLGYISIKGVQALATMYSYKIKAKLLEIEAEGITVNEYIAKSAENFKEEVVAILKQELDKMPDVYIEQPQKMIPIKVQNEGKPFSGYPQNWKNWKVPRRSI